MPNFSHIIHKKSNVVSNDTPNTPSAISIEYGEIAINYAEDHETLFIKNDNNEIVTISSDEKFINDNEELLLPSVSSTDNGKILKVVNGQWQLVNPINVYSGGGTPSPTQGENGDIYIQTS